MRRAAAALCLTVLLAACGPKAPAGVDKAVLDQAISEAIGDPGTCVLVGQGGRTVYQYGTHVVCGRKLPACDDSGLRSLDQLLEAAPTAGAPVTASCRSNSERTRIVAWAAGPIEGSDLVYAVVMEGDLVPPGIIVADKLSSAFARAGLGAEQ